MRKSGPNAKTPTNTSIGARFLTGVSIDSFAPNVHGGGLNYSDAGVERTRCADNERLASRTVGNCDGGVVAGSAGVVGTDVELGLSDLFVYDAVDGDFVGGDVRAVEDGRHGRGWFLWIPASESGRVGLGRLV